MKAVLKVLPTMNQVRRLNKNQVDLVMGQVQMTQVAQIVPVMQQVLKIVQQRLIRTAKG